MDGLDLENIRFRAERGMEICLGEHSVEHEEGEVLDDRRKNHLVKYLCNGRVIDWQRVYDDTSQYKSDEIQAHVMRIRDRHEREVIAYVLLTLIDQVQREDSRE